MKWNGIGRFAKAIVASAALGLGMTACGGGTIGYLWVLGQTSTSNASYQIAGFKIDQNTGNLTRIPGSPFSSGGVNPVQIVVRSGGRYVYVVNRGDGTSPGNIESFSVGGDGTLVAQQTYTTLGNTPVWAAADSTGGFLYVLDRVNPSLAGSPFFGLGAIDVYSIASDTGRLALVTNSQVRDPSTNVNLNYFPVGLNPSMLQVVGGCVFTLDGGDQTVFPYQTATGGQLNLTTSGPIVTGASALASINIGGGSVYLTESSTTAFPNGRVLPFTVGTNCALNSVVGGATANISPAQNPVWALREATRPYLYLANQSSTDGSNNNSSISVFTIRSDGTLTPAAGQANPQTTPTLPVGSGPVCLVEDPTNQYIYASNGNDGTVSGFGIGTNGQLQPLRRGSTFPALTHVTCLAVSGSVG